MSEQPIVAFQGEHGAYSEQAVRQHFGPDVMTRPCRTFQAITDALQSGQAQYGMLPVENSLAGTVVPAYDLLMDYDLHIQAEAILRADIEPATVTATRDRFRFLQDRR